jgi:hypothetical protein
VYWYTLLSDTLLHQHQISLTVLSVEAVSTNTLRPGIYVLKFFEKAEDWRKNAERVDSLCERVEGVFCRRRVEAALAGISNLRDYEEVISRWR